MINARNVQHKKWTEVTVLFDDDVFSVIWGRYDNSSRKSVAMRWNGVEGDDPGYPKLFKNPVWFNLPDWQIASTFEMVNAQLAKILRKKLSKNGDEYVTDILVMLDNVKQAEFDWKAGK